MSTTDKTLFWKNKVLAFLHDPPEKCLDIQNHEERRKAHVHEAFGQGVDFSWFFSKVSDHTAAAADRFCFPKYPHAATAFTGKADAPFHHPLGDGKFVLEQNLPSPAEAERLLIQAQQQCLPARWPEGWNEEKIACARFFLLWRFWQDKATEKNPGFVFLPADTRIPDHTIWTHNSIVSALQGCVEVSGDGENAEEPVREFKPAFLLIQLGPVQEFIAQARTTRDLWSGSYMLSWLMAHAMKAVSDRVGPDAVLFPNLCGQPIFDLLHRDFYGEVGSWKEMKEGKEVKLHTDEQMLTPSLPNRFLAVVPESQTKELAEAAEKAIRDELKNIGEACWEWFNNRGQDAPAPLWKPRWDFQIEQFPSIHWQVYPWSQADIKTAVENFKKMPAGKDKADNCAVSPADALQAAYDAALKGIPEDQLDPRNYKHQSWKEGDQWKSKITKADGLPVIENAGFAWSAHYAQVDYLLAARRNTRDFDAWGERSGGILPPKQNKNGSWTQPLLSHGAVKDMLSGKEEVIGSEEWQKSLYKIGGHYFRKDERLGAMNLIKRVWHEAYLNTLWQLKRTPRFDSLPAVAAAHWARAVTESLATETGKDLCHDFDEFGKAVEGSGGILPPMKKYSECKSATQWIEAISPWIFVKSEWERGSRELQEEKRETGAVTTVISKLNALVKSVAKIKQTPDGGKMPPLRSYIAVLAVDGDSMGQWVSGAKSPKWGDQLAAKAKEYFQTTTGADGVKWLEKLLETPRHVTPSYHLQFSEALANFGVYLAGNIVEWFDGQLVYAGGDDVLALLPADQALPCAEALRKAFRGDPSLHETFPWILKAQSEQWGFVGLDGRHAFLKRTKRFIPRGKAIIVPGKRTDISAGIAIGHIHSPLQNLVQAAQKAEKRAKGQYGRAAFAVSLFKRSGEIIEWGAKWESGALALAREYARLDADGKVSGRFPYALTALLEPYAERSGGILPPKDGSGTQPLPSFNAIAVYQKEIEHVLSRQGKDAPPEFKKQIFDYLDECKDRTLLDFVGPFLTQTFLSRGGEA